MKATNEQILESYQKHKSVWKAAKELGMAGQTVHQRLQKLGANKPNNVFSDEEKKKIKNLYESNFIYGDGKLNNLCIELNRSKATICAYAKLLGFTSNNRKHSEKYKKIKRENVKNWYKNNPHPRGMVGKTHSPEYKKQLSIRMTEWRRTASDDEKMERTRKIFKTKIERYGSISPKLEKVGTTWRQGWREIGDKRIYCRSRWEANYGRFLEFLKKHNQIKEWEHEPKTFWFTGIKRGTLTYLPDYKVINLNGSHYWVEVKGWYDDRSKTKIKRFHQQFPDEKLILVDATWFKDNNKKLKPLIPEWESDQRIKKSTLIPGTINTL